MWEFDDLTRASGRKIEMSYYGSSAVHWASHNLPMSTITNEIAATINAITVSRLELACSRIPYSSSRPYTCYGGIARPVRVVPKIQLGEKAR